MRDNYVEGGGVQLDLGGATVSATENEFLGGTYSTIRMGNVTCDIHGNRILNAGGWSVRLEYPYTPPEVVVDMTGNYWGTTDAAQIAEWIYDGNDPSPVFGHVDFIPFLEAPTAAEPKTWGQVKGLYR
jgi:hypothetical protein